MIASFLVFGLVVDRAAFYLDFAGIEVSLEVGGIVLRVPETPFEEAEQLDALESVGLVGDRHLLYLTVEILRNEEGHLSLDTLGLALNNGIAHTVAALVAVKVCLYGRPAGVPYMTVVVDVEIASAHIHGNVVIAVTCNTAQSRVLIEAVTARGIGDKREKALCSEVVYPRVGSFWRGDDVFLIGVVEVTEFHWFLPVLSLKKPQKSVRAFFHMIYQLYIILSKISISVNVSKKFYNYYNCYRCFLCSIDDRKRTPNMI